MQNSLDRLLEGMAVALGERVLPVLDDPAAAAQVRATIELLGNLAPRVSWDVATLAAVREAVTPALEQVVAAGAPVAGLEAAIGPPPSPLDPTATRTDAAARLRALGRCQAWLAVTDDADPGLRASVDEAVDRHLALELALLRSGSWARPADGVASDEGDAS